jgi:glycosyltransferase involved in cell wall biosynthesis
MILNKISVVMSVYKNDNVTFFSDAIQSVLKQSFIPSEIIIVVDGWVNKDIDALLDKYSSDPLFLIIRLKENRGLANALNIGVSAAKYDLIARMDSDDICFKSRFEKQVKALNEYDLDIVGGQIIEFGKDISDVISRRIVPCEHSEMVKLLKFRSPFSHPTIIFKRNVFDVLKGYDSSIFPEDYDFFVRAFMSNFKFGNVPDEVLWFRLGENKSDAIKRRWGIMYAKNEFKLYKKFLNIKFFNYYDFFKAVSLKIPIRLLPFFMFKFVYYKMAR